MTPAKFRRTFSQLLAPSTEFPDPVATYAALPVRSRQIVIRRMEKAARFRKAWRKTDVGPHANATVRFFWDPSRKRPSLWLAVSGPAGACPFKVDAGIARAAKSVRLEQEFKLAGTGGGCAHYRGNDFWEKNPSSQAEYQRRVADSYGHLPFPQADRAAFDADVDHRLGPQFRGPRREQLWRATRRLRRQAPRAVMFGGATAPRFVAHEYSRVLSPSEMRAYFGPDVLPNPKMSPAATKVLKALRHKDVHALWYPEDLTHPQHSCISESLPSKGIPLPKLEAAVSELRTLGLVRLEPHETSDGRIEPWLTEA